jgi:hypothetical protein
VGKRAYHQTRRHDRAAFEAPQEFLDLSLVFLQGQIGVDSLVATEVDGDQVGSPQDDLLDKMLFLDPQEASGPEPDLSQGVEHDASLASFQGDAVNLYQAATRGSDSDPLGGFVQSMDPADVLGAVAVGGVGGGGKSSLVDVDLKLAPLWAALKVDRDGVVAFVPRDERA